jgi:AcrR family transcriptional regulator
VEGNRAPVSNLSIEKQAERTYGATTCQVNKIRPCRPKALRQEPPEQREATRERIVAAALRPRREGFRGASTRHRRRAGTNQGLITYHFRSKDELWRAAAERIFGMLAKRMTEQLGAAASGDPRERAREAIRIYVRFAAAHPELFRLMVDEGKSSERRMRWLVDTHLKPRYEQFMRLRDIRSAGFDGASLPHAWYVMAGAASLIFAVAPECRRLTGLDPETAQAIEAHAEFVARLLVP